MHMRSPETRRRGLSIEGEPIEVMEEIEIDRAQPLDLPTQIVWPDSRLEFAPLKQTYDLMVDFEDLKFPLYTGKLVYRLSNGMERVLDLSHQTANRPTVFTGSRHGFFAHDPRKSKRSEEFYLVGVEPHTLLSDQRRLVSIYHELGHVEIYDRDEDVKLLHAAQQHDAAQLPGRAGIEAYMKTLADADDEWDKARGMSIFHERFAWAGGLQLSHRVGAPLGFREPQSALTYAKYCLSTYARFHNDQRFVRGLGKRSS